MATVFAAAAVAGGSIMAGAMSMRVTINAITYFFFKDRPPGIKDRDDRGWKAAPTKKILEGFILK
jgi:hypothetical protein